MSWRWPDEIDDIFHVNIGPIDIEHLRAVQEFVGIYDQGLSAATLAAINAIMAGLWVLVLNDAETRHKVRNLKQAGHRVADPVVRDKIRLHTALNCVGACALISTLLMVIFRPSTPCTDGCNDVPYALVLGGATNVTAAGIIAGAILYIFTWRAPRKLARDERGEISSGFAR